MDRREELLREIARMDEEINKVVASAELPKLAYKPFPTGTWILAAMCFAWWRFGDRLPGGYIYHFQSATYAFYLGIIFAAIALLSTTAWLVRGRGQSGRSEAYLNASRDARELQERRRELQAELRSLARD